MFGLLNRQALDELNRLREKNRFLPGLRSWVGFDQRVVFYDRGARASGLPKQSFGRLLHYALNGIFSFSYKPLRLMVLAGSVICALGFVLAARFVIRRLAGVEQAQMGFTTLVTLILFMGGVQLVSIGLLGEYLARIYDEVKARPLFIVRRRFPEQSEGSGQSVKRAPDAGMTRASSERARWLRTHRSRRGPAGRLLRPGHFCGIAEEHDVRRNGPPHRRIYLLGLQRLPSSSGERQPAATARGAAVGAQRGLVSAARSARMDLLECLCDRRSVLLLERQRRRHPAQAQPGGDGARRRGTWRTRLCVGQAPHLTRRRDGSACVLFVFSPTLLAHGPLVTSDIAAAFFFTAAVGAVWVALHRMTPATVLGAGVLLAGAFLSKLSAPILMLVAIGDDDGHG